MGVKFRKRVEIFPGFKLNFSLSGMSATIGPAGANVNVGKKGAYLNTGIPGTGLYDRKKISGGRNDSKRRTEIADRDFESTEIPAAEIHPEGEIKSYNAELLTSEGLFGLKSAIVNAGEEKQRLKKEYQLNEAARKNAKILLVGSYVILVGFVVKWFKDSYRDKSELSEKSKKAFDDFSLEVDFNFDKGLLNEYTTLKSDYIQVCESSKIWDITTSVANDRVKTRSTADTSLLRKAVSFNTGSLDFINTQYEAFVLKNANGGDLYIYPGFIVMLGSNDSDFGLIDLRDVRFEFALQNFIEEEGVPSDAKIIGNTWKYANKNGSPDRRFSDNYEIPIAQYAQIDFRTNAGMCECYQVSNSDAARIFARSMDRYLDILSKLNWSKG